MSRGNRICLLSAVAFWMAAGPGAAAEITGVAFSPDGKALYSTDRAGLVFEHDAFTGQVRQRVTGHRGAAWAVAVSPDGKLLATAGSDRRVTLRNPSTLAEIRGLEGHARDVVALAFSADGKLLASGGYDGVIRIWDLAEARELRSINEPERATGLAFLPDGKTLAAASVGRDLVANLAIISANPVRLFDVATGQEKVKLPVRGSTLALSADGRFLVAGGYGVFPIGPGEQPQIIINRVALRPANRVVLWDLLRGAEVARVDGQGSAVALSPDGRFFVTARGSETHLMGVGGVHLGLRENVRFASLWERVSGQEVARVPAAAPTGSVVALSPDGRRLAFSRPDGSVGVSELTPPDWAAPVRAPGPDELRQLWDGLMDANAVKAHGAVWTLANAGDRALPLFRERLKSAKRDVARIRKLLEDLDSEEFRVREAASEELAKLGVEAEPELRHLEKAEISAEARRRLNELLEPLNAMTLPPEQLRAARAVLALEWIGTPEARAVLEKLAAEDAETLLAREARAALARLPKR
jgi:WD40 repeat protein